MCQIYCVNPDICFYVWQGFGELREAQWCTKKGHLCVERNGAMKLPYDQTATPEQHAQL